MKGYIFLCVISYVLGIGSIAATFLVQKMEDQNRPPGYHIKATLTKIHERKDGTRKLDFSFFLLGKPVNCSAIATMEESRPVQTQHDYLVVYNDETGECVFNPCQKYRIAQAVLIIGGIFITLFAVLLTVYGVEMFIK